MGECLKVLGEDIHAEPRVGGCIFNMNRDSARTYKRVPAGLPADDARADWLRHTGLFASLEQPVGNYLFRGDLPAACLMHYQRLAPLQRWLVNLLSE
jgi:hypothetical protein